MHCLLNTYIGNIVKNNVGLFMYISNVVTKVYLL